MEGNILGVKVEIDHLTNPDVAKRYEDRIVKVMEQMHAATSAATGSEGIRMQCQAVIDGFVETFGEEKTKEILGEKTNLFICLDAFDEFVNLYPKQVTPILEERTRKYDRGRIDER